MARKRKHAWVTGLTTQSGIARDLRGMEFKYKVHIQRELSGNSSNMYIDEQRLYSSIDFPRIKADSLNELKRKMSEIG